MTATLVIICVILALTLAAALRFSWYACLKVKEAYAHVEKLQNILAMPQEQRWELIQSSEGVHVLGEVEHWAIRFIVLSLAKSIGDAENFVTMTFESMPTDEGESVGPFEVTVRRLHGKSAAQILEELRKENDELRRRLKDPIAIGISQMVEVLERKDAQ